MTKEELEAMGIAWVHHTATLGRPSLLACGVAMHLVVFAVDSCLERGTIAPHLWTSKPAFLDSQIHRGESAKQIRALLQDLPDGVLDARVDAALDAGTAPEADAAPADAPDAARAQALAA